MHQLIYSEVADTEVSPTGNRNIADIFKSASFGRHADLSASISSRVLLPTMQMTEENPNRDSKTVIKPQNVDIMPTIRNHELMSKTMRRLSQMSHHQELEQAMPQVDIKHGVSHVKLEIEEQMSGSHYNSFKMQPLKKKKKGATISHLKQLKNAYLEQKQKLSQLGLKEFQMINVQSISNFIPGGRSQIPVASSPKFQYQTNFKRGGTKLPSIISKSVMQMPKFIQEEKLEYFTDKNVNNRYLRPKIKKRNQKIAIYESRDFVSESEQGSFRKRQSESINSFMQGFSLGSNPKLPLPSQQRASSGLAILPDFGIDNLERIPKPQKPINTRNCQLSSTQVIQKCMKKNFKTQREELLLSKSKKSYFQFHQKHFSNFINTKECGSSPQNFSQDDYENIEVPVVEINIENPSRLQKSCYESKQSVNTVTAGNDIAPIQIDEKNFEDESPEITPNQTPSILNLAKYDERVSPRPFGQNDRSPKLFYHMSNSPRGSAKFAPSAVNSNRFRKQPINQDISFVVKSEEKIFETFGHESEKLKHKKTNDYSEDVSVPDLMVQVRRPKNKRILGMDSTRNSAHNHKNLSLKIQELRQSRAKVERKRIDAFQSARNSTERHDTQESNSVAAIKKLQKIQKKLIKEKQFKALRQYGEMSPRNSIASNLKNIEQEAVDTDQFTYSSINFNINI